MKIDGKQLASEILENLKQKIQNAQCANALMASPTMAVILIGDNPASLSYIKQKQKSAELIGAKVLLKQFPDSISQNFLITQISQLNSDPTIHGIIVQRPLPPHIDKNIINESVSPTKDIDGFHPESKFLSPVGLAVLHVLSHCHPGFISGSQSAISNQFTLSDSEGQLANWLDLAVSPSKDIDGFHPESKFLSPVGLAVLHVLNHIYYLKTNDQRLMTKEFFEWINSQKILLMGRGETGGKPIANTMDKLKIKYIQTHSKTKEIKELLKQTDIIISAVGKPNFITGDMIKKGAICIGIGISRTNVIANEKKLSVSEIPPTAGQTAQAANNNLTMKQCNNETIKQSSHLTMQLFNHSSFVGDFDEPSISEKASFYTPVPGGIGPLTVTFLLDNLIKAWENVKT